MIDKISSFFSHQKNKSIIPLYFTEDEKEFIQIEITPEKTIYQIYLDNINQISVIQAKIYNKKTLTKKNFCFTLYSNKEPSIRIKLNNSSQPWQYLIIDSKNNVLSDYSLFYSIDENYLNNNQLTSIHRRLNNLKNKKNNEEENKEKPFSDETHIINFVSPYNKVIDGDIEKYSYSQNMFIKIFIYIDSNKIMYKEVLKKVENNYEYNNKQNNYSLLQNLWNVIPLANVSCIDNNSFDEIANKNLIDINKFKDRLLMIKTFNKENLILKLRDKNEKEIWFNELRNIVEQVRVDKIFNKLSKEINDISKKIYLCKIKFTCKLIGIKGIICFKNSRKFFFKNININNDFLENIVECCVEYKNNVIKKNNMKALEEIKKLGILFGIDEGKKFKEEEEKNNLNYLLDEETILKISNMLKIQNINKRSSLIIPEVNLLNNLLKNIEKRFLIKEHKRIIHQNQLPFINSLNKIPAAQFCKNFNFNSNKMNILFPDNMNINVLPDQYPDLYIYL